MIKSALVVGASGFIGSILHRKLGAASEGTFYSHPLPDHLRLDIRDAGQVGSSISRLQPSVIYHPAATPNVDWCEDNPDACRAVNVAGTRNLVDAARKVSAKLVFFSTDYVFDGNNGPYWEQDEPNPLNVYAQTKYEAEQVVSKTLDDYLIIRVTIVYGWERDGKNSVMSLLQRLKNGSTVKVPADQIGSPTYADNMTDIVLELVRIGARGTFHVCGDALMDRYAFACLAADTFDLDKSLLLPVTTAELGQRARRPLKAGMRIDKVRSLISTPIIGPEKGLLLMKQEFNAMNSGEHS